MLRAMQKKTGSQISSPEAEKLFLERGAALSGADIEAVLVRARMRSALENDAQIGCRRSEGRAGRFHSAVLSHRDRAAEPGGGAGVHQPEAAAAEVQDPGPRRNHPPGSRVDRTGGIIRL